MSDKNKVEVIARGLCVRDGKVLLCYGRKSGIAYLPGGHIDFGESGQKALEREIMEEMGLNSRAGSFLGCCEHCFVQDGERHAEINLVYELDVAGLDPADVPQAVEDWIGFKWQPLNQLQEACFEPVALGAVIGDWLTTAGGGHLVAGD